MKNVMPWIEIFRRLLFVLVMALWFGGFTFYALVVIHTGHRVFDSRVEVGFLTQAVTRWLNLIGIGALTLMLWNAVTGWRSQSSFVRVALLSSWALVAGIEVWLFALHPRLDALLDSQARAIISRAEFKSLHLFYMNLSTVQWGATIVHFLASLLAWRRVDQSEDEGSSASAALPALRATGELRNHLY